MTHIRKDAQLLQRCLRSVGSEDPMAGPSDEHLDQLRRVLENAVPEVDTSRCEPAPDSKLQAGLAGKWLVPRGAQMQINWLKEGLPGISMDRSSHHKQRKSWRQISCFPTMSIGFAQSFPSRQLLSEWLGGTPRLTKLGMIAKEKEGKTKRRLILDCKESGVNKKARLLLPRITDIVDDAPYT